MVLRSLPRPPALLAALTVTAITAAALAAASQTASSAEVRAGSDNRAEPDAAAEFTACLGDATTSAGFADTRGIGAEAAIDCLAYYGITKGRTPTMFAPGRNVTRSQMALFVHRAVEAADVRLPREGDADFTDTAGLDPERARAVGRLAVAGVLEGRSSTLFEPHQPITRAEMAVALVEFLRLANPDLFHGSGARRGELRLGAGQTLDHFADARRTQPAAIDDAISYAYELGITTGTAQSDAAGATRFAPDEPVLRKQMASFITRTLAHTNLRPFGVTAQQNADRAIVASVRGEGWAGTDPQDAARQNTPTRFHPPAGSQLRAEAFYGNCASALTGPVAGPCLIDSTDIRLDGAGNANLGTLTATQIGSGVTVTVWAGETRQRFNRSNRFSYHELTVRPPDPATVAATVIVPETSTSRISQQRFGTNYEVELQLRSGDLARHALRPATSVGLDGRRPAEYSVVIKTFNGWPIPGGGLDGDRPAGVGGLVSQQEARLLRTDRNGKLRFEVTASDPDPQAANQRTVQWVVEARTNAPNHPGDQKVWHGGWAVFADDGVRSEGLRARPTQAYQLLGRSQNAVVEVTLTDQFGRPLANRRVSISSSLNIDANRDGDYTDAGDTLLSVLPPARSTDSDGRVQFSYEHRGRVAVAETLTVAWDGDSSGTADTGCRSTANPRGADICASTTIYWAQRVTAVEQAAWLNVLVADAANDTVVVDSDTGAGVLPMLLVYEPDDVFDLDGALTGHSRFEAALGQVERGERSATIRWSSYEPDTADDIARFDLRTAFRSS